ncbi:hypothetical protein ES703_50013 [subsurface metagenome]
MHRKRVLIVGGLHFSVDIYGGFFAIYMVIVGLDPVKAALISSVASFISHGLQPLMGFWADRIRGKMPVFLGVLVGAVSMSAIGVTKNYIILFCLVLMGTMGISLFHPAGINIAGAAGLDRKERSVSIFIFIGTVGYSLSQPYFSLITGVTGTQYSFILSLPAVILAFSYLLGSRIEISGPEQRLALKSFGRIFQGKFRILLLLFVIMVLRHGFIMTLGFFIARVFSDWGFSRISYSFANTFYNLSGAVGILASGIVTHRMKSRTLILISLTTFFPFFVILILAGMNGCLWPAFLALGVTGFILQLAHVSNIVLGHHIFPEGTSTISGILMGFAWAFGRMSLPLVPVFSNLFNWAPGLVSGLIVLLVLPIIAVVLTLLLPKEFR